MKTLLLGAVLLSLNVFAQDGSWTTLGCKAEIRPSQMSCEELNKSALKVLGNSDDNAAVNVSVETVFSKYNAAVKGLEKINQIFRDLLGSNYDKPVANPSAREILKAYSSATKYVKVDMGLQLKCLSILLNELDYRQSDKNECL